MAKAGVRKKRAPKLNERQRAFVDALKRLPPPLREKRVARPFSGLPQPPPGVFPDKAAAKLAMDAGGVFGAAQGWADSFYGGRAFSEGLEFLGYPYLAELSQRPEYRRAVEIIAGEMTRKWITLEATGDDKDGKQRKDKIEAIGDMMDRLQVRDHFRKIAEQDGFFGRAHLYLDTGSGDEPNELVTDLGNGRDKVSRAKVGTQKPLLALRPIEAVWTYPQNYNAVDPLREDWYNPQQWFVMGKQLHISRLLTFISRPVPDLLKPSYSFGGLALTQMMKPYVDNWLTTRQGINDIVLSFSVFVLLTLLADNLQTGGQEALDARAQMFNALRDNRGLMVIDKELEGFTNVSAPIAGLDALQAQSQEHMASPAGIPLVKLFGITPHGLNASSEGEIRTFYDTIAASQEALFRAKLQTVMDFCQLSLFDEVDESITFKFRPLFALDEKGQAEVDKLRGETAQIRIDSGVVSQEEERKRIAADPDGPYPRLDPDEMPDLLREEEAGLEPVGGRPELQAAEIEEA